MRELRAKIRRATGSTVHSVSTSDGELLCDTPSYVVISEQEGAIFLFRFSDDDECLADTWHLTIEEAKEQARFEYEIEDVDWIKTNPPG